MMINFVANFQSGYVGEIGDATHLVRELRDLGHEVRAIPQDAWREYVIEGFPKAKYDVPEDLKADINIICKWHHFYDGSFIKALREKSEAPVFYWVWDYMWDQGLPQWHIDAIEACDLYLGNDIRHPAYKLTKNAYYFPFDVSDGEIEVYEGEFIGEVGYVVNPPEKIYDVSFFGSWIGQGHRQEWLKEINKTNPLTIFTWNPQDWPKEFDVHGAVYGKEFAKAVGQSKICLGFSVDSSTWGYWSNRVGKTLLAKGFLLYEYAPGMELFLRDGVEYFSSIEEAREKIDHYLIAEFEREKIAKRGYQIAEDRFTSKARVKELVILIERYLKDHKEWKI